MPTDVKHSPIHTYNVQERRVQWRKANAYVAESSWTLAQTMWDAVGKAKKERK